MLQILNLSLPKGSLKNFFIRCQISSQNSSHWSFYLGRAAEVHLLSKDEGPRDIWHDMNMEVNTRKFNFFESLVVLILHLIHSDTPWQNAADIITQCDSYFKTKFDRSLLQNASGNLLQMQHFFLQIVAVITKCVNFITKCGSFYKSRHLSQNVSVQYALRISNVN